MLNAVDEAWRTFPGYNSLLAENWHPDMGCHIMLAACREYEYAKEVGSETGSNGLFTKSLIDALTSDRLTERSTYMDLLKILPSPSHQSLVVAGDHKDEQIWYYDQL